MLKSLAVGYEFPVEKLHEALGRTGKHEKSAPATDLEAVIGGLSESQLSEALRLIANRLPVRPAPQTASERAAGVKSGQLVPTEED